MTLTDGRVLVVGGLATGDAFEPRVTAEIFDPATGRWSPAGRIRTPRIDFGLTALPDGGAIVAGGYQRRDVPDSFPEIGPVASAERFDPTDGNWSATGEMRVAASGRTTVSLADGRVSPRVATRPRPWSTSCHPKANRRPR